MRRWPIGRNCGRHSVIRRIASMARVVVVAAGAVAEDVEAGVDEVAG